MLIDKLDAVFVFLAGDDALAHTDHISCYADGAVAALAACRFLNPLN